MMELKRIYWSRQALRLAYSAVIVWMAVSLLLAFMQTGSTGGGPGVAAAAGVLNSLYGRALAAAALPGLFIVGLGIVAAVVHARDVRRRDPVRRFSRQQRKEGMARAGGRCELEAGFRRRCARPAEHGDHFYPWSKGGSTNLQNFVAACAGCNRAKGARIPSPGKQARLEGRRRDYVASDGDLNVGARQPLP